MKPLIHFVHGKESGPWGTKIRHLANIARNLGFDVESLDYSSTFDPAKRVEMLVAACRERPAEFLVGSSMGSWVALNASAKMPVKGLFLMAPAIGIAGYPPYELSCSSDAMEVVHGWHDELIPVANITQFCEKQHCTLHLVDDGHRLKNRLVQVGEYLTLFLKRMQADQ